jgi:hypothetical protein
MGGKIKILFLIVGIFIFLSIKIDTQAQELTEGELNTLLDDIKNAFKVAGIDRGYVQYDEINNKIELTGVFKDYDEFLSAFMIAQARAGVSKVSPAYNPTTTVIKIKTAEKCISQLMLGRSLECKTYIEYKETVSTELLDKKMISKKHDKLKPQIDKKMISKKHDKLKPQMISEVEDKLALIVAVSKYRDERIPKLHGPPNDAELVKEVLEQRGYKTVVLKDENATLINVLQTIEKELASLKPNGSFLLYVSTHGAPIEPNGMIGFVMYDTNIKEVKCKTLENTVTKLNQSENKKESVVSAPEEKSKPFRAFSFDINKILKTQGKKEEVSAKTKDIIITANKMCSLLESSLKMSDVLKIISSINKPIRFISIIDTCYSGSALKHLIEGLKEEVYHPEPKVVERLVYTIDKDFIYSAAASGEQPSLEYPVGEKKFGVYTYFYFNNLPKNEYDTELTYKLSFNEIKKVSSNACKILKQKDINNRCLESGQAPIYIKNKNNVNTKL